MNTEPCFSRHAAKRLQQRAIPIAFVDLVIEHGIERPCGGGCSSHSLDKRGWHTIERRFGRYAASLRRARDLYVVTSSDGAVITAAWRQ